MEDAKYFFKYKDYDLAKAYFENGNTIYCDDLGPYGGKRGEVISFNVEDVELDEDDAEENNYTAEDLNEPVVFDQYVSQLHTNTIEWDSTIGDLWCWEEDLEAFKKDHPEYKTEDDKINEIVKMIRDNHIDPKKIMDKLNDKVEESLKQSDMELTEAQQILRKNGYLIESTDNYREIVTKKLAQIYDNCYDSDDAGRSYAEKHVAEFEPQIAEVLEEGGDAPISPYEVAEVIWYMLHHSQLMGKSILGVYWRYTRNEPDFFETWHQFNP